MLNLIKNELYRIFRKKATFIFLGIILIFMVFINYVYTKDTGYINYFYEEGYADDLREIRDSIDKSNPINYDQIISLSVDIDVSEYLSKLDDEQDGSWKIELVNMEYMSILYEYYNTYYYDGAYSENSINLKKEFEEALDTNNVNYFLERTKSEYQEELNRLLSGDQNTYEIDAYTEKIAVINDLLDRNVLNNNPSLHFQYQSYMYDIDNYYRLEAEMALENVHITTKQEFEAIEQSVIEYEYMFEKGFDPNKGGNLNYMIQNIFIEYTFFIVLYVLMIAGSIVSEEFSKGTIKTLLVTPYSRTKILLSKFITIIIMTLFIVFALLLFQLIVGGIFYGYDSLSNPVAVFDYATKTMKEYNLFVHFFVLFAASLPLILILATIAFTLSVIVPNTAFAMIAALVLFIGGEVLNMLVIAYDIEFMKYFITLNWDLTYYLFGGTHQFEYLTFGFSLAICIIYLVLMLVLNIIIFKKKNVKND